jgi:hypothetical protein
MVMNDFETTLSSALQAEADRSTQTLDTIDAVHRLEARFERIDRNRRHRTWATALTAAAAIVVAGGVYAVMKNNSPTTDQPVGHPSHSVTTQAYKMLVADDANGPAIHADVKLYGAWGSTDHPLLSSARKYGGLAVYKPDALAAGNGCLGGKETTKVGRTPQKLAQQLTRLPRSAVLQPPTRMQAFGRQAIHLQLRINPDCGTNVYRVADTIEGGHGISYGKPSTHVVIDFWVENVRGVPVVIETWHQEGTPRRMVEQIGRSVRSVTFGTGY